MLPRGAVILACVSGGADSMCLLHLLLALSERGGFSVAAAHYNHRLRGAESDGDEAFVRDFCAARGVPLFTGSGDTAAEAARTGRGIEETARSLRYAFFRGAAEKACASRIATAHTADDNAETMLLHFARGAGLRGLCGIPPVRGGIVRPLLTVTRAEVDEYLAENAVPHREDSSNAGDDYARNRIRHAVVPVLRGINPAFSENAAASAELLRSDEAYLASLADAFIAGSCADGSVPRRGLAALPFPVASRAVRMLAGTELTSGHVAAVLRMAESGGPSDALSLPETMVRCEYGRLVFGPAKTAGFDAFCPLPGEKRTVQAAGVVISCDNGIFPGGIHKSLNTFLFKSSAICGKIIVRPRLPGDRIRFAGSGCTKSLKKLFIEKTIPAVRRASVPVIADDQGPLAIVGVGRSDRALPACGDSVIIISAEEI